MLVKDQDAPKHSATHRAARPNNKNYLTLSVCSIKVQKYCCNILHNEKELAGRGVMYLQSVKEFFRDGDRIRAPSCRVHTLSPLPSHVVAGTTVEGAMTV